MRESIEITKYRMVESNASQVLAKNLRIFLSIVIIGIFALLSLKLEAAPPSVMARDWLDWWGINAPCCGGPQSAQLVAQKLNQIGIRRVRVPLVLYQTSYLSWWQTIQSQMQANGYVKPLKFQDLVEAYNNDANTSWDMQKPYILQAAAAGLLGCLEGPNEMNNTWTGGGTHGVNNTADMTNNWAGPNGNVVQWASAIKSWVSANSAAPGMANVKILAPSIATGLQSDFASLPNLASLVDYGNVHYYAANGMPPNQGNCAANPGVGYFANIYHWCQAAEIPTGSLVVSECGQSTATTFNTPHSQAAYILNQIHDAAGIGARGFDIYCMFDPNSGNPGDYESNFGVFKTDGTAKPAAIALSALKHLFSLNLNYDDPANLTDTAPFTPAYNPAQLSVTGISCSSRVANAVVFPKSDGTTLISVTDEPALTDGNGNAVIPAQETATVNFGSTQSWSLYDILGADPLQPVASGKGSSVQVELNGYPMYLLLTPPNNYTATNTRTVTPIFSPTATPTITATPTPVPPVYAPCNGAGMALDGVLGESVWALSSLSSIPGTACSYSGCGATDAGASAQYKAAWNSTGLWIGVVVSDPGTLYANAAAPWNGSGVEVFLDLNNTKAGYNTATGNYNDANTYQFAICYNSSAVAEYHNATARTILAATTVNTGSGYTMEIEIPWAALGVGAPAAGSFSGLDVAVDVANAAGTARDHQIVAVNGSYNLYDQAPAQWWVLNYQACGVSSPTTSPTRTASATVTQTATPPRTASPSASPTRTLSATATATLSSSSTSSPSSTLTRTPPPTLTFTVTPSFTASPAGTLTHTPTWSETPTYPPTATRTPSHTPTFTRTGTPTASPSGTATLSVTASLTATLTPTPSATKTSTLTPSPFPSGTRTPSATPFNSATLSSTATPTASETVFATQTPTPILTASSTPSTFATPASQGTAVGDRGQGSGLESAFFTPNPVRNGKIGLVFKVNGQVEGLRARIYTSAYMKVADVAFESEGGYGNGWHYVTLDSTRLPKGLYFGVIEAAGKAAKASLMVF